MSEEPVEIVRQAIDAFNRSDRASVEPLLHPDVEWRTVLRPVLGVETVSSRDAVLRFGFEDIPDAIDDFRAEVEELRDLGEGKFSSSRDISVGDSAAASSSKRGSRASTRSTTG